MYLSLRNPQRHQPQLKHEFGMLKRRKNSGADFQHLFFVSNRLHNLLYLKWTQTRSSLSLIGLVEKLYHIIGVVYGPSVKYDSRIGDRVESAYR